MKLTDTLGVRGYRFVSHPQECADEDENESHRWCDRRCRFLFARILVCQQDQSTRREYNNKVFIGWRNCSISATTGGSLGAIDQILEKLDFGTSPSMRLRQSIFTTQPSFSSYLAWKNQLMSWNK